MPPIARRYREAANGNVAKAMELFAEMKAMARAYNTTLRTLIERAMQAYKTTIRFQTIAELSTSEKPAPPQI